MKVLLVAINAKYIHSNLAVYSLKAYAEKYAKDFVCGDNQIELAEYTINQQMEHILRDIYANKPDIIGFSCYIWNVSIIKELIVNIKKVLPQVEIWMGGPEVSYNAVSFLEKYHQVRGVMCGEGEEIFKNVLEKYARCASNQESNEKETPYAELELTDVLGIVYSQGKDTITNLPQPPIDMSDIPFVYEQADNFENRIVYYESSRGCPFSCSYCLSSIDKKLRFRNIELVKKELKYFIDNKTAQVKFVDRTFNCKHEHALEIWKFIKDNDNGVTNFHFEIAADLLNEEEIRLISTLRPGLIQLEIGVQTTNAETINLIDRKMDFDKVADVVEKLKEPNNVHLHLDLIAGLPKEGIESFMKSFNMVYGLKPEQLQLGFLKILHGSKIEQQVDYNEMEYLSEPPYEVLSTKWLSFEDILRLKRVEEVVEIYYNTGQFASSINELEKYFDTAFEMYDKLGVFYSAFVTGGEKHSRIKRYELLLEFFRQNVADSGRKYEIFVSLLIFDVYLRDNIKSRPVFAPDLSMHRREITSIYIREEEDRMLLPDYTEYNSKQLAKMTHIEVFDFDIINYINNGIDKEGICYILFDYCNRNPLNYDARTIHIKYI